MILAALLLLSALLLRDTAHSATAAAEWCDTDPVIHNVTIGDRRYVVHVIVSVRAGDRHAAHEATAIARTLADGRTIVTVDGPPVSWRVSARSTPGGYVGGTGDAIHAPRERIEFALTPLR